MTEALEFLEQNLPDRFGQVDVEEDDLIRFRLHGAAGRIGGAGDLTAAQAPMALI